MTNPRALAPGYTPRQVSIDAEMVALGRPQLTTADVMRTMLEAKKNPNGSPTLHAHHERVEAWEHANPDAAVRWIELRQQARAEDARIYEERYGADAYSRQRMHDVGFPAALVDKAARELRETECFTTAREWLVDGTKWLLVLSGKPGCGKSQAATWAAFQLMSRGFDPRCARCPKVSEQALYGGDAEEYRWFCSTAGVLVLDDLGEGEQRSEKRGAWRAWVDDVMTQRHAEGRKTIITTNRTPAEFTTWLGSRITDRMREGAFLSTKELSMRGAVAVNETQRGGER